LTDNHLNMLRLTARLVLCAVLPLSMVSCELLNQAAQGANVSALKPELGLGDVVLVSHPTTTDLAAWYCPEIIPSTGLVSSTVLCEAVLGPRPPEHRMQFHFEIKYLLDNPNNFPVPTTEILAAIEVFRGQSAAELGAVCVTLCNPDDFACNGEPGANDCKDDVNDIETIDDLKQSAVTALITLAVDAATGNVENRLRREIPAGAKNFEVNVRFSLGVNAMIDIMRHFVEQLVQDFYTGKKLTFEIPISVRGTLWFEIPYLGRVALKYGPIEDTWLLEP